MNVVITGASRGIGRAIAETFAAKGFDLILISRRELSLYNAMEEMGKAYPGISIKAKPFDLSVSAQAKDAGEWVLGSAVPDIVVNNAGNFEPGSVHNEPEGVLESQIATNLYSAYHFTRTLLPGMIRRKSGHIFNMCSIASMKAYPNGGAYSISKFALYGFSKNLREEMMPYGIKVTSVIAGAVMTDSWSGFDNSKGRIMEAKDIATLVFAASQLMPQACVEDIVVRPQLGDV